MDKVHLGIIGLGNMGSGHIQHLKAGQVPRCELAAVCDIDAAKLKKYPDVKGFTDSAKMIRSGLVDAVLIATPHYFHTTIGIDALNNGLHVLTEKPISVHKADAMRLIAAHEAHPELVFAAMFNQRTDPHYIKIKQLIEQGELGKIQRTNWIITTWFRSEAYYRSGGWRATWGGEGGGVLLNQCPHNLDLFQWLCGMPSAVTAIGGIGKYHDIEVEDDITAMFEYPNGATGVFVTTTGEAPGTNRLEIAGTRGKLVCEGGRLTFTRNEIPADEFSKNTKSSFGVPSVWNIDIPVGGGNGEQHIGIKKNFVAAILDGAKLIAPAEEGLHSVEMANAMLYSMMTGKRIELPLDEKKFEAHLKKLIKSSTFVKKDTVKTEVDFAKSQA
ncbi:MAG: Gfo/Idh/MocA family oxidoreductase [Victivallales bacterium]|nr:Gfo/Idh/MocA family oxidoreductase [Victivallales bacterium]